MFKKISYVINALAVIVVCSGCATQNIALPQSFWQEQEGRAVLVAMTPAPQASLHIGGAVGLLDYGIITAANSKLNAHLKTTDTSWYAQLSKDFVDALNKRGVKAKKYNTALQFNQLNDPEEYFAITEATQTDALLILRLKFVGVQRNYYSMIPTTKPKAVAMLYAELIDTDSGDVLWQHTSTSEQSIPEQWSQPPNYPNLTNTLASSMNTVRNEVFDSFFMPASDQNVR